MLAAKFFSRLEHPSYRLPKGQVENYVNFCTLIIMHFVYHKAIIKTNYLMSLFLPSYMQHAKEILIAWDWWALQSG